MRDFLKMGEYLPIIRPGKHVLRDIFGGDDPAPAAAAPDYAPMAAASAEAAQLGKQLGDAQLAESRRQYDNNMAVAKPVVDAQLGLMAQSKVQGDDYYNYMVANQRPVEQALNAQSMKDGSVTQQEEYAQRAQADQMSGYTRALNIAARQGLRYGYSPSKMAAQAGSQAGAQASAQAAAANAGRQQSQNLGWARKMDVAGLYRGLTGASTAAYGLASNAGSAAVGSQMAPGSALMAGMNQGAGMQQTGQGQRIQGLGGVLSAQGQYANSTNSYNAQMASQGGGGLGALLGAGAQLGSAYMMSDRRLKENITKVGYDSTLDVNLYEFNYIGDTAHRYQGVMADEVEMIMPDAVVYDDMGFAAVNYGMLGIQMVEV